MKNERTVGSAVLGICIFLGLSVLGYRIGSSALEIKQFERSVSVKGLAEREVSADIAIWPIQFTRASNDLAELYESLEKDTKLIVDFLGSNGFSSQEITLSPPAITDKLAQHYGNNSVVELRYSATRSVTLYSERIEVVRTAMNKLVDLGKQGIVFSGDNFQNRTEFLFTGLNEVKPAMVEEATRKAREVAEKFAKDSESKLGKIKRARQGQFSIEDRDKNTPYIKRVRVVSTVEYYLSD
jgi:hypothetical protein